MHIFYTCIVYRANTHTNTNCRAGPYVRAHTHTTNKDGKTEQPTAYPNDTILYFQVASVSPS